MADATTEVSIDTIPTPSVLSFQIKDAETVYHGRFLGLAGGEVLDYAPGANTIFLGPALLPNGISQWTGDASASPRARVGVETGPRILRSFPVVGASAITNIGAPVYGVDNATLSLSQASNARVVGHVKEWISSTLCDVHLLSVETLLERQ